MICASATDGQFLKEYLHCPESGTTPESVYGGGKCGFSEVCGARLCSVMPWESRKDVLP